MRSKFAVIAAALITAAIGLIAPVAAASTPHTPSASVSSPVDKAALASGRTPVRPPSAVRVATPGNLTGCTSSTYPSTAFGGWTWRTTYRTCPSLGDLQQASSCVYVDRFNPAAVPDTVLVTDWTCLYSRLR